MTQVAGLHGQWDWADAMTLGYSPLDEVHAEFATLLRAFEQAADECMAATLEAVLVHCREHFAQEERWMAETGYPISDCHKKEHRAVLASIQGVAARIAAGDLDCGRRLAAALTDWFPGHTIHLDSALAHWMFTRTYGGMPVVVRASRRAPA